MTNVASARARHTTTTTRDTSDATSPSFRERFVFEDVSSKLFIHACMQWYASIARPPAARRTLLVDAGVRLPSTAVQLRLPWKTTNL